MVMFFKTSGLLLVVSLFAQDGEARNFNKPKPLIVDVEPVAFLAPKPLHSQCKRYGNYNFESSDAEFVTSAHNAEVRPITRSIQDVLALTLNPDNRNNQKFKIFIKDFVDHLRAGNFQGERPAK